jgi:hypothetical protein
MTSTASSCTAGQSWLTWTGCHAPLAIRWDDSPWRYHVRTPGLLPEGAMTFALDPYMFRQVFAWEERSRESCEYNLEQIRRYVAKHGGVAA